MARAIFTINRRDYFNTRASRVTVNRQPSQSPIHQHRHEFFEIVVVLSGTGIHVAGATRHPISVGDVLFLDPTRSHGYRETRNLNLLNILVRNEALQQLGRELGDQPGYHALFSLRSLPGEATFRRRLQLSPAELSQIDEWAGRLEEAVHSRRAARLLREAYLTLIINVFSRKYGRQLSRRFRPSEPDDSPSLLRARNRIGRILSWMEIHWAKPLRLADLAAQAGMSERTFLRVFRAKTGISPHAYLVQIRLGRAARHLLEIPDASVTEIANACGFDDSNYFSQCFRRFHGSTPSRYRKKGN